MPGSLEYDEFSTSQKEALQSRAGFSPNNLMYRLNESLESIQDLLLDPGDDDNCEASLAVRPQRAALYQLFCEERDLPAKLPDEFRLAVQFINEQFNLTQAQSDLLIAICDKLDASKKVGIMNPNNKTTGVDFNRGSVRRKKKMQQDIMNKFSLYLSSLDMEDIFRIAVALSPKLMLEKLQINSEQKELILLLLSAREP